MAGPVAAEGLKRSEGPVARLACVHARAAAAVGGCRGVAAAAVVWEVCGAPGQKDEASGGVDFLRGGALLRGGGVERRAARGEVVAGLCGGVAWGWCDGEGNWGIRPLSLGPLALSNEVFIWARRRGLRRRLGLHIPPPPPPPCKAYVLCR